MAQALLPAASALLPTLVATGREGVEWRLDAAGRSACATVRIMTEIVRLALEEDIGTGDVTSIACVPESRRAAGRDRKSVV